jgi:hypothetical protein
VPKPTSARTTRKVTKVARTGGGRTKRGQTSWIFPSVLTVAVIAGTFLIAFSRAERQPDTSRPRVGADHWHAAIGFDICGTFAPNVPDNGQDPLGIHTHGDGIVHTHPFSSQSAGKKATLKVWLDTVGASVTPTQVKLPNDDAHKNGQKCGDKDATVLTKVWDTRSPDDTGRIFGSDPRDIHLKNNQLITVAFVPEGSDIPRPPSERQLDNLSDVGANATSTTTPGGTAATTPGGTAATTTPGTENTTPATAPTSTPTTAAPSTTAPAPVVP